MFTIAGILADEEPKTAVSASGLYDSSVIDSNKNFSETLFAGLEEFTVMYWVYHTGSGYSIFQEYNNTDSSKNIKIRTALNSVDQIELTSTAGTTLTVLSNSLSPTNTWTHVCFTGSLANNRLRVYKNGVLDNSAVMPYGVTSDTNRARLFGGGTDSLAQWSFYNRELSEEEVSEHYVYDSDTMTSGVLGYDAMTTSQRSGLIYLSSFIDDIPFDGSEFKDRSGNNITLSSQPSLTGQQIYIYTDASDLPSDEPNAFAPNVATLDGSTQYFELENTTALELGGNNFDLTFRYKRGTVSRIRVYSKTTSTSSSYAQITMRADTNVLQLFTTGTSTSFSIPAIDDDWHVYRVWRDGSNISLMIDQESTVYSGTIGFSFSSVSENLTVMHSDATSDSERYTDGSLAFWNLMIGDNLTDDEWAELNQSEAICFNDLSDGLKTKYNTNGAFYNLSTFNGRAESTAIVDQAGSNDLTAIGSPTYEPTGALIVSDGGVQYNINFATLNGSTQGFTQSVSGAWASAWVSVRFKLDTIGGVTTSLVVRNADSTFSAFRLYVNNSGNIGLECVSGTSNSGFSFALGSTTLNTGQWYHVVGEFVANTSIRIYLDGVLEDETLTGVASSINNTSSTLGVGRYAGGQYHTDGAFCEYLSSFDQGGISLSDVQYLYNEGTAITYSSLASDKPAIESSLYSFNNLSNWTGNTGQETTDKTGNGNTLTAVGSPTYESELAVECDEDPV